MKIETKRHVKASAALIGTGAIVLPLVGTILEGLAEVMNAPVFAQQIESWFGVGSLMTLVVLTLSYRVVAWALNAIAERSNANKGIAAAASSYEERNKAVKI